jgi:thiol-disulfide isomerase/thioredoxin
LLAAVLVTVLLTAGVFAGKLWLDGREATNTLGRSGLSLVAVGDRSEPIDLSGETLDGETLDVADWRGQVVVVNVWGSWCGPCREEAPDLVEVYESTRTLPVQFVGIDVRDGRSSALAFQRRYGIRYPSFFDEEGRLLLAFTGSVPVGAVPSTVVLDPDGRIAASNAGVIDAVTLRGLIDDVLAEETTDTPALGPVSAATNEAYHPAPWSGTALGLGAVPHGSRGLPGARR